MRNGGTVRCQWRPLVARWKNAVRTEDEIFRVKRDAVLRESGRIFNKRGYHNTSLAEIAKALDVSKGTLYNYVKDKQDILFEFHKMALAIGDRAVVAGMATEGSGAAKLATTIRTYIAILNEEMGGYAAIAEIGALKPHDRKEIVARRDHFDACFVEMVKEGIDDKSLRQIDAKMAVMTFMGALQAIPNWFSPEGRLSAAEVADRMTDLLLNGMTARNPLRSGTDEPSVDPQPLAARRR